nr:hypothetical protein [Tanacetum cinerariifolium]
MTGDDNHESDQPETSNPSQPIPPPTSQLPHTVSSIKLPILKNEEYDIWAMKMEHYLCHKYYPIWQKMQKDLLKQQFEGFFVSSSEGLHKGYDRFQTLLSQLKIHGAGVLHEDANQKFLRVFERDVKGTTASSSSNTQNVAFVSANYTSSTNIVSTAYSVSSPSVSKSQQEGSSSYTDEVINSFFSNQSSAPQLDCDDLEKINDDDLVEMDLKWQVAMISMRIKKFHKRTGRKLQFDTKDTVGFDKTKVECFNCHKIWHFARDYISKWNQDSRRRDGGYNGNKARDNSKRPAHQDLMIMKKEAATDSFVNSQKY